MAVDESCGTDGGTRCFSLRLDSGAMIGPSEELGDTHGDQRTVRLSAQEAMGIGKLSIADLNRLEGLVDQARMINRTRSEDWENCPPHKRPRRNVEAAALPKEPRGQAPFYKKCLRILEAVVNALGVHATIFTHAVDEQQVPDYYQIIKTPMDLGTVKSKLLSGQYRTPQDFEEPNRKRCLVLYAVLETDVDLVWANCFLYNKKGDFVEQLGQKGSAAFRRQWATAELSIPNTSPKTKQKSCPRTRKPRQTPSRQQTKSIPETSASTAKPPSDCPTDGVAVVHTSSMTRKEMKQLVEDIMAIISKDADAQGDILNVIKEADPVDTREGEVELDISELDEVTQWKLKDFVDEYKEKEKTQRPRERPEEVYINKESSSESSSSSSSDDSSDSDDN